MIPNNCWSCKYRGSVPGSAHVRCRHPTVETELKTLEDKYPLIELFSILGGVGRGPSIRAEGGPLHIKGDPYGIRSGWFNWPLNFDPTWLERCDGYEKKEEETKVAEEEKGV